MQNDYPYISPARPTLRLWLSVAAVALTAVLLMPRLAFPLHERWLDAPRGSQFHFTLWRILLAAFLFAGMRGWGRTIHRALHREAWRELTSNALNAPVAWGGVYVAIGAMALVIWLFLCGTLGLFNRIGAALTFALLLAGFLLNWIPRDHANHHRTYRWHRADIKLPGMIALAVLVLLTLLRGVEALAPPYSWDAQTYHLAVPAQWLAAGKFTSIPMNIYSNMPMNLNLVYLAVIWLGDPIAAKLMHFGFGLMAAWGLVQAGRRLGSSTAGWAAALIFLGAPSVYYQWGAAFVDVGMAFGVVALAHLLFDAMERPDRARGTMIAAGIVAAFIIGGKYTGLYAPAALLIAAALAGPKILRGQFLKPTVILPSIGAALILFVPWLLKNFAITQNPVYPLFFDVFGGSWWSERQAAWIIEWQRGIGMGRGPLDYLLLPWRVAVNAGGDYGHYAGRLMALPFALSALVPLFWGHARLRVVWMAFWLGFAMWALGSQQIRFLIPLYPLLCLSSGMVVAHLALALANLFHRLQGRENLKSLSWRKSGDLWRGIRPLDRWPWAAAALIAPIALMAARAPERPIAGPLDPAAGWAYVSQQTNAREFLRPRVRSFEAYEWLEIEIKEGRIAKDSRVVMLFENMGFFCPLPWTADGMFEASWLANLALESGNAETFAERLQLDLNPDLILVNGNILRDIETGRGAPPSGYRTFRDETLHADYFRAIDIQREYIDNFCDPIFTSHMNTTIYRPKPIMAPPPAPQP